MRNKFNYHPDGHFTRKTSGKRAGSISPDGRERICIDYKMYLTHRLIYLYHHGYLPDLIDHIDYDKTNNRIENLREANHSTNKMNRGMAAHNTSGYKNVVRTASGKWGVQVRAHGKSHWGGSFEDVHEAGKKAKEMTEQLHGEFARCD